MGPSVLIELARYGYALALLVYLALGLLLAVRRPRGTRGGLFFAAVAAEAAWAAILAALLWGVRLPMTLATFAEAARFFLWTAFLLALLRAMGERHAGGESAAQRAAAAGFVAAATVASGAIAAEVLGVGERPAFAVDVIGALLALVCIEQIYRNSATEGRWALKFLAIALVALFGYDLVMYSEALLFSRLNPALWAARGFANAMLVPLLVLAASRNRQWKLDLAVSREVVFHSATLTVAGTFLLAMAMGGYWLRWFGGDWGEAAQALFIFAALVLLGVVFFSGTLRARLRVLLAKHFFRYRYDYRAEWLRLTELLSDPETGSSTAGAGALTGTASASPPSPRSAAATSTPLELRGLQGLARLVESPGGALWLAADDGVFACSARWNYHAPTSSISADEPLAAFMRGTHWVVSLPELHEHPERYDGLTLAAELSEHPEVWLVVPLMLQDELIGFCVLTRPLAPVNVDWEVRDALKAAARQVASYLAVRRAVESLVQARQFESFNRMSAFVVHDLKNLVAQLSLLMANAARHRHNPEFQQDMLDTVENVLGRMQGLLMQLRAGTRPIEKPAPVPLGQAIDAAIRTRRGTLPQPELLMAPDMEHVAVLAHRDRLERVIGHLVQNAAEATPHDGRIWVRVTRDGDSARIEVEDTGKGMSEQFVREQLFRPFESTKTHGMGIGAFESRDYVRELGGALDVESRENAGTLFRIRLPLAVATAA